MTAASLPYKSAAFRNGKRSRFSPASFTRPRNADSAAKGDMNVTPFIDVLLVLLVMIILAVPIKVHETSVDLPTSKPLPLLAIKDVNTVHINASDQLFWNGEAVTPRELRTQIEAASTLDNEPTLRFEPDALASYDRAARTIALIKESGASGFAFAGNERYKDFGF